MAEGLSFSFMLTGGADKALPGITADSSNPGMEETGGDNPFSLLFNSLNTEEPQAALRKNSAALAALALQLSGKADTAELSAEAENDSAMASQLLGLISQAEQTGAHWQLPVAEQLTTEADMVIAEEQLLTDAELLPDDSESSPPDSNVAGKAHHITQNTAAETDISDDDDQAEVAKQAGASAVVTGTATRQASEQDTTAIADADTAEQGNSESPEIKTEQFVTTDAAKNVSSRQTAVSDTGKAVAETPVEITSIAKAETDAGSTGGIQAASQSVKAEHAHTSVSTDESAESKTLKGEKANAAVSERVSNHQTSSNNSRDSDANQQSQTSAAPLKTTEQTVATSVTRAESFVDSLTVAEQRQQLRDIQPATVTEQGKSLAEQLKQSLNLLQQDAATHLRERVHLMVRQNIQVAEIRLDPAELGQMQIKVNMQQDQASVQFLVQQPQAKELLEQQLPRLRELLQQQGIQLAEGQVQQQQQHQQSAQQKHGQSNHAPGNNEQGDSELQPADRVKVDVRLSDRLVDYYA